MAKPADKKIPLWKTVLELAVFIHFVNMFWGSNSYFILDRPLFIWFFLLGNLLLVLGCVLGFTAWRATRRAQSAANKTQETELISPTA